MNAASPRIAVFAKAPVPGQAKTRLIPALGPDGAARLHARLVTHTLTTVSAAALGPVTLWCAPDTGHPYFDDLAQRFGVTREVQRGADLGERMFHAFEHQTPHVPLLLIGTDCPALGADTLRTAAHALMNDDAVFVPAEDGGYALIGLNHPERSLFEDIPWGSGAVMSRTRDALRRAGLRWTELDPLWDVDRPEDLPRLNTLTLKDDLSLA